MFLIFNPNIWMHWLASNLLNRDCLGLMRPTCNHSVTPRQESMQ